MSARLDQLKMIRFCEEKNKRTVRSTGLKLYLKADLDELERGIYIDGTERVSLAWQAFVETAKSKIYSFGNGLTNSTCAWCKIFLNCGVCTYGKRHGICRLPGSRYRRIRVRGMVSERIMVTAKVNEHNIINSHSLTRKVNKFNSITSSWYKRVILKIECDSYQIFWSARKK